RDKKMKELSRVILPALAVVLFFPCLPASPDSARDRHWHEDLQQLTANFPQIDKALLSSPDKTRRFKAAIAELDKAIARLDDTELTAGIMKAVAAVGASHTMVPFYGNGFHYYPIQLVWFPDGIRVVTVRKDAAEVLGARIVQIGDTPVAEVLERLKTVVSH